MGAGLRAVFGSVGVSTVVYVGLGGCSCGTKGCGHWSALLGGNCEAAGSRE